MRHCRVRYSFISHFITRVASQSPKCQNTLRKLHAACDD